MEVHLFNLKGNVLMLCPQLFSAAPKWPKKSCYRFKTSNVAIILDLH